MQKLILQKTENTPEIHLSPEENIFHIKGNSAPEDVRALYYPVLEWIKIFIDDLLDGEAPQFTNDNPLNFNIDMSYFNSSSAKFMFDIFSELKRIKSADIPFIINWYYDEEDTDMRDAGKDISDLAELDFTFISKPKDQ